MGGIAKAIELSGVWMWPIIAMSAVVFAVMIERFYTLFFRYNINAEQFMAAIRKHVLAGNIAAAIKLCNATPNAILPQVIKAGLVRANQGEVAISNAIEEAQLQLLPQVRVRTNALAALANIVTLIGLMGTVIGMIKSFGGLATADEANRQTVLTSGISIAMYTTAGALMVAIPALLAHLALSGLTNRILDDVEHYSVMLEDLLVTQVRGADVAQ